MKKCLNSLVKQSLKDIEIIIVNDGSQDGSQKIIDEYSKRYKNIKSFQKQNGGQASARNYGMKFAKGRYIAFTDSDDYLPKNAYEILYHYATSYDSDIVVGIVRSFNLFRKWTHENFRLYFQRLVINTHIKEYPCLTWDVSSCNKLYRKSFLEKERIRFPENTAKEDVHFTRIAYFKCQSTTIIPYVVYYYRGRQAPGNLSGTQRKDLKYIEDILSISDRLKVFYEENGLMEYWPESIRHTCQLLINRIIRKIRAATYPNKLILLKKLKDFFKRVDYSILDSIPDSQNMILSLIKEGLFDQAIMVLTDKNDVWILNQLNEIGASNRTLMVYSKYYLMDKRSGRNRLDRFARKILYYMRRVVPKVTTTYLSSVFSLIHRLFKNNSGIWLVGERMAGNAQDNGFFFFKYCSEKAQQKRIYYVIRKKSMDIDRVRPFGNTIYYNSLKHIQLIFIADVFIFTDTILDVLPKPLFWIGYFRHNFSVWLQHGVTAIGSIHRNYNKSKYRYIDKLITTSENEKKIFTEKMKFMPNEIEVTGFARWDRMKSVSKVESRIVLFVPSWRHWLKMESDFAKTKYFSKYQQFLNSSELAQILDNHHLTLQFYPHFNIHGFLRLFSCQSQRIEIVNPKKTPLFKLIERSCMAITDYSSVSFDFIFQQRPVILYQFDFPEWAAFKLGGGYYNYHNDLPMDVVDNEEALFESLEWYALNKFNMRPKHKERIERFFKYRDSHNCERIYNCVENLSRERSLLKGAKI